MGLGARLRRLFSPSGPRGVRSTGQIRAQRGGYQSMLDREATPTDLDELREFVASRTGVEFYLEPETTATDTTVAAVAADGEWIRRRVGSARIASRLATELGVPLYDAGVLGYPAAMRRYRRS
ncbi:hypothetical protein NUM_49580 [Actinocatenispora comari]|jgi:hypothetical protein|uniref:Uncharacterized protein n=2 Tax=Actinocatenispora comari TaxID=2807577 RepID=A0A8J4AFJ6_9ACTN|nr:hypothetical protein NUM_49580 [Actinocatenispora comari]